MAGRGRGRGRGRAKGKRLREVGSEEENSISQESSKDEDFVPSGRLTRYATRSSSAIIARSPTLRSSVRTVIRRTNCLSSKLNPPHNLQSCTSKQPPEDGDLDSVPKTTCHSSESNLEVIVISCEEPISGNGDNAMPHEDDLTRNDNNSTETLNVEKTDTASLDSSSTPISKGAIDLDQPVAPVPDVVDRPHQKNYVDTEGLTNFIGNRPHSHCLRGTTSNTTINVTELAKRLHDDDENEEVESAPEPGLEDVWGHKVQPEFAPILRRIFNKHGDIAAQTDLKSPKTVSVYLQQLCRVCEALDRTNFLEIKRADLKSLLSEVRDFEEAKLDVGWLRERLEYVYQELTAYQQYSSMKEKLGKYDVWIEGLEKKVDRYKSQLCDVQRKVCDAERELEERRAEAGPMRSAVLDMRARVKNLAKQSLVEELY